MSEKIQKRIVEDLVVILIFAIGVMSTTVNVGAAITGTIANRSNNKITFFTLEDGGAPFFVILDLYVSYSEKYVYNQGIINYYWRDFYLSGVVTGDYTTPNIDYITFPYHYNSKTKTERHFSNWTNGDAIYPGESTIRGYAVNSTSVSYSVNDMPWVVGKWSVLVGCGDMIPAEKTVSGSLNMKFK